MDASALEDLRVELLVDRFLELFGDCFDDDVAGASGHGCTETITVCRKTYIYGYTKTLSEIMIIDVNSKLARKL